jgi:hypothetical protein
MDRISSSVRPGSIRDLSAARELVLPAPMGKLLSWLPGWEHVLRQCRDFPPPGLRLGFVHGGEVGDRPNQGCFQLRTEGDYPLTGLGLLGTPGG